MSSTHIYILFTANNETKALKVREYGSVLVYEWNHSETPKLN